MTFANVSTGLKSVLRKTFEDVVEKNKALETQLSELLSKNKEELRKSVNDLAEVGVAITHTDNEGTATRVDPTSEKGINVQEMAKHQERIKQLEAELKNPPKSPLIGLKKWTQIRKDELAQLKQQTPTQ